MAILGHNTLGGTPRALDALGRGSQFTASENSAAGIVLRAWATDQGGANSFRMSLYSVTAGTANLIASSDIRTDLTSGFVDEAFTSTALDAVSLVSGTSYIPLIIGNNGNCQVAYDTGTGTSVSVADINSPPSSFTVAAGADSRLYSTWIVYTPAGGGAVRRNNLALLGVGR